MTLQTLARDLKPAVLKAGQLILDIRAKGFNVEEKNDTSPVTEADRAAEDILVTALKALVPDAVIVAEEMAAAGIMPETLGDEFYLIDPLDGTKEFIRGGLDFT
ncbi:MAG: inositol monophosphatase family protein, partial [Sphingomonadales bacterium]